MEIQLFDNCNHKFIILYKSYQIFYTYEIFILTNQGYFKNKFMEIQNTNALLLSLELMRMKLK